MASQEQDKRHKRPSTSKSTWWSKLSDRDSCARSTASHNSEDSQYEPVQKRRRQEDVEQQCCEEERSPSPILGSSALTKQKTVKPPGAEPRPMAPGGEERERAETPLGSLERTNVSLGDSDNTTDSKRFIDEEWGVQGTMLKIMLCVALRVPRITVEELVARGPVLPGHRRTIMARCFMSVLKLRTQGFVNIIKEPVTLAIQHIVLGPRITKYD